MAIWFLIQKDGQWDSWWRSSGFQPRAISGNFVQLLKDSRFRTWEMSCERPGCGDRSGCKIHEKISLIKEWEDSVFYELWCW
ncbi:hypothetical protein NPIL_86821 [Nephila pilipes]|uniref:Uncharacterized protein n=1 Tax=Nephila pilipes TaxID=299642 RepID=A0A8X6KDW9_NEPPI|nr:hypothetical protein NPIL_86821 [Nephila pilipes]